MLDVHIDRNALAVFIIDNADFCELYEADEFVMEFEGQGFYVERRRHWFTVHVGADRIKLPRC